MFGSTYLRNKKFISFILFQKTLVLLDVRYNRNFLKPLTNQFYLFLHLKSIVKWLEIWNKMNVIIFIKS
jgi:hypothetical protein